MMKQVDMLELVQKHEYLLMLLELLLVMAELDLSFIQVVIQQKHCQQKW